VIRAADPYGRIFGFLDRSSYFSSKQLLNCTHEAEWTPFHTHYFSGNLDELEIETGTSGSVARDSDQTEIVLLSLRCCILVSNQGFHPIRFHVLLYHPVYRIYMLPYTVCVSLLYWRRERIGNT
jgi:hypothetical protein